MQYINDDMSVIGIGTDIVNINRIDRVYALFSNHFVYKILHKTEINYLFSIDKKHTSNTLAKHFCVKESVMKCLGTGWRKGVRFKDISLSRLPSGEPIVQLYGVALSIANSKNISKILVTISDEEPYVISYAIAIG